MAQCCAMPDVPLVSTGIAAKALGVAHSTLARWWHDGLVTPTLITAGNHARWDLEDLREQLRALRTQAEPARRHSNG